MKFLRSIVMGLNLVCALSVWASAAHALEPTHRFSHGNALGTSLTVLVRGSDTDAARIDQVVIREVARLEQVFSSYREDSELSQINRRDTQSETPVSDDFLALVSLCEQWQSALKKAFSCRMGRVIERWNEYEASQERPDRISIRAIARQAHQSAYTSTELTAGLPNPDYDWSFGAIAKGFILDKALSAARKAAPGVEAIGLDIGGDTRYWQSPEVGAPWSVSVAVPGLPDDSGTHTLGTVQVRSGAVAYSGNDSRARKIQRSEYGHILTPRDGWPKANAVSAVVVADSATTADVLATALTAMDVSVALDWINERDEYAALLVDEDGRQYASNNWYQTFTSSASAAESVMARIQFEIPTFDVAEYRQPYLAIWVENDQREVVKNLLILGQSEQWMEKNRTWWRVQGRDYPQLLQGVVRTTRRPGTYDVIWNGRDEFGDVLPSGNYTVYAEAVREHGGHEKLAIRIKLGEKLESITKKGKSEIASFSYESLAKH
jgi:thiamine biosynthesis lipoprotein